MEQFSLEKYLENPSRKVITRDGRKARIICTDAKDDDHPIIALVEYPQDNDSEEILSYTKDGLYYSNNRLPKENDLVFVPEKHEGWVNVYKDDKSYDVGNLFSSKEDALAVTKGDNIYVATIKIEWEE